MSLRLRDTTEAEEELLLHAWAVLQENVDLARWAVCWVTGRADAWDCLLERIEGDRRTTIRMRASGDAPDDDFTAGPVSGIQIVRGSLRWQNDLIGWLAGVAGVCDLGRRDAACLVLDLACTLLHETIHVCARAMDDASCDCDRSYLVANIFRWALMRRYASVSDSSCCSPFIGGKATSLFGDSCGKWGHDCIGRRRPRCIRELTGGLFE